MNISKFTQKSIQAVQDLEKIAYEYGNQEVEQEHLLYALLSQEDSLILKLIEKMEIIGGCVYGLPGGRSVPSNYKKCTDALTNSVHSSGWTTRDPSASGLCQNDGLQAVGSVAAASSYVAYRRAAGRQTPASYPARMI